MTGGAFSIRFWGTRGSLPVSGEPFRAYGGNTICFEVRCGDERLIFDAGSGILPAGLAMKDEGPVDCHLFFSHSHYDHIIGFPYFKPLYDADSSVEIWSGHMSGKMSTARMLRSFMRPPWFPVDPQICSARLDCRDFRSGDVLSTGRGVTIRTGSLNHPGGCIGYRIEWGGRALAIITDHEHIPGETDPEVMRLIEGADLMVYDACYTDAEMERYRGFGHSTWEEAVRLCQGAGVTRTALVHHAPWRTDADLDAIGLDAARAFQGAFVAADGQTVHL